MSLVIKDANLVNQTQKTKIINGEHVAYVLPQSNDDLIYFNSAEIIPTTLTNGLNYFQIRNTSATKKIKIQKIEVITYFVGTAAASRSNYALKKFTGATAATGTVLSTTLGATTNPATIAGVSWLATGLTLTGATIQTGDIAVIGHPNLLSANIVYDKDLSNSPIILEQNEGIVLQSKGAIVAGSTILFSVKWLEE
jgi:hypothetical protein